MPLPATGSARSLHRKSVGRRLGLVACGLLAGWAAAEVLLRVLEPDLANGLRVYDFVESESGKFCQYDETLGWVGKANVDDAFQWADCRVAVRQNRYGFRGRGYELARSTTPRFVALGDSFVWGFGVEDDEIVTSVMERESTTPIEVVNLGVSAWGTDQELLLWERTGRFWKPDHVLLFVTISNDLADIVMPVVHGYPKPLFHLAGDGALVLANVPVPRREEGWREPDRETRDDWKARLPRLLRESTVVSIALQACARIPLLKALFDRIDLLPRRRENRDWQLRQYLVPQSPDRAAAWKLFERLLARLAADAVREGADLTVVAVPPIVEVYPEMWQRDIGSRRRSPERLDADLPERMLADVCRRTGVALIELLAPLRGAAKSADPLYYPLNLHWTAAGNRVAAEAVLEHFGLAPAGLLRRARS